MFSFIVFMLAAVGLLALAGLTVIWVTEWLEAEPADEIPAAYRDGMEAASRVSAAAWEAEQALYRAAWKAHNE